MEHHSSDPLNDNVIKLKYHANLMYKIKLSARLTGNQLGLKLPSKANRDLLVFQVSEKRLV
jgi:hypothetical protein